MRDIKERKENLLEIKIQRTIVEVMENKQKKKY